MLDAEHLKLEKRGSQDSILTLSTGTVCFSGEIKDKDQVKLKLKTESKSTLICVKQVVCVDEDIYRGIIYGFRTEVTPGNFLSSGPRFNQVLTIGQEITFKHEHVFFISRD